MGRFARIVNGWEPLIIFAKRLTLNAWQRSEYSYVFWPQPFSAKIDSLPAFTCSKLTMEIPEQCLNLFKLKIKTSKRRYRRCCSVFIVNFEQISHILLMLILLLLKCRVSYWQRIKGSLPVFTVLAMRNISELKENKIQLKTHVQSQNLRISEHNSNI